MPWQSTVTARSVPGSTTAGPFSALPSGCQTEAAIAGIVKLSVQLPQAAPILYVSTKPVPGWKATT